MYSIFYNGLYANTGIQNLISWLERWERVHIKKTQKVGFSKENPGARAVLISGPPGIGKTSTAIAVGKIMGFDVVEFNASDTRNAQSMRRYIVSNV